MKLNTINNMKLLNIYNFLHEFLVETISMFIYGFTFYLVQILSWFLLFPLDDFWRAILVCTVSQSYIEYNRRFPDPIYESHKTYITNYILGAISTMIIGILWNILDKMLDIGGTNFPIVCLMDMSLLMIVWIKS